MRKGQIALEFMFAIGFLVLFVIVVASVVAEQKDALLQTRALRGAQADCALLARAIAGALINPGTAASLTLAHNASVHGDLRVITVDDVVCTLPFSAVSGEAPHGFSLRKGAFVITSSTSGVRLANA